MPVLSFDPDGVFNDLGEFVELLETVGVDLDVLGEVRVVGGKELVLRKRRLGMTVDICALSVNEQMDLVSDGQ